MSTELYAGLSRLRLPFVTAFCVITIILPIWLVLVNSWKPLAEAQRLDFGLPAEWAIIDNYGVVLSQANVGRGLLNSLVVSVGAIALILVAAALASWVFARSRARSVGFAYHLCVVGIIIPTSVITTVLVLRALNLYGGQIGLILTYVGIYLPIAIFLITGFVKTIPRELEDAARIDGCGSLQLFVRIILPLLAPILVSTGIILLIFLWNDFYVAFFLLRGTENQTLPLGLYFVSSGAVYQTRWNLVFAHVILTSLPMIVMYVVFQRRVVSGITEGAIRG